MDIDEVEKIRIKIGNDIYNASGFFEEYEHTGLIIGNGHHKRQRLAQHAQNSFVIGLKSEFRQHYLVDVFGNYSLEKEAWKKETVRGVEVEVLNDNFEIFKT